LQARSFAGFIHQRIRDKRSHPSRVIDVIGQTSPDGHLGDD
jgi:hypothetical protein